MKRRLILIGSTFLTIALAFGLYWLLAGSGGFSSEDEFLSRSGEDYGMDITATQPGKAPLIIVRDDDGRIEGIYQAADWDPQDDGSYLAVKPNVQMFQSDGTRLIIRGDRGVVFVEEIASGVNPRRGLLEGNVEVIFDRSTEPDPPPMDQRPEDLIRIYVDDIQFNNDLLQMTTESRVTLFSQEVDIVGRGLLVRWNDDPQELRVLRIEQGEFMSVKQMPEDFEGLSLSGSAAESSDKPAPTTKIVPEPLSLDDQPLLRSLQGRFIKSTPKRQPSTMPATAASSLPATQPVRPVDDMSERKNVYQATFFESVHVDSADGHIHGADELSLVFEWDTQTRRRFNRQKRRAPKSQPTTTPSSMPVASGPAAENDDAQATTQSTLPPVPTSQPASDQPGERQMIITWSGPLELRPVGTTENPSQENLEIHAEGRQLRLWDAQMQTECQSLLYIHPQQIGQLTGSPDRPVVLRQGDGAEVLCPEVRFNSGQNVIQLVGAGHIVMPTEQKPSADPTTTQPADEGRITWGGSVTARLKQTRVETPDGRWEDQIVIDEAIFRDDVELRGGEEGEFVRGEKLHLWLAGGSEGLYPRKAIVDGNAKAHQDDRDISADTLTVLFEPQPKFDEKGQPQPSFHTTSFVADGHVSVTDRGSEELVTATADNITADVVEQSAVLIGSPAKIVQGDNKISGEEIHLDQLTESASVRGPGSLQYITDKDFSGQQLDEPRAGYAKWSKQMDFKDNRADFLGDVEMTSGLNTIQCQYMEATFEVKDPDEDDEAPEEEDEAQDKPTEPIPQGPLGMKQFDRRRLATVWAFQGVKVNARREDDQQRILQRFFLTGEEVRYNVNSGQIDCFDPGQLLAEDYRPPKPKDPDKATVPIDDLSGGIERPWQTAFTWRKQMQWLQRSREVIMDGQVTMSHRSGQKVLVDESVNRPDWPELPEGRITDLSCGKLIARFAPPKDEPMSVLP